MMDRCRFTRQTFESFCQLFAGWRLKLRDGDGSWLSCWLGDALLNASGFELRVSMAGEGGITTCALLPWSTT